jgi:CheY-like chemotaxis protein
MNEDTRPRILLADDEADIALVARTRLEVNGFEVVTAADGEEALKRFRESRPDLVLLDLKMPKLGGEEVCRILKSSPDTASVPVILFSASSSSQVALERLIDELKADGYIRKPYTSEELLNKVCQHLTRPRVPAGSAS